MTPSTAETKREVLKLISHTRSPERKAHILETIQAFAATDCRVDWDVIHRELTRPLATDQRVPAGPLAAPEPSYEVEELEVADLSELGFDLGE